MEKRLIARGVLAGVVGAMFAYGFARLFAEPVIGRAVEYEDGRTEAAHAQGVHEHGAELFSRGVQGNAGLGFGLLIFGAAMGALLAVAFCVAYSRSESAAPRTLSIRLVSAAFITAYLVPFVKYPPNPPAVGQADTIAARTLWYLVMLLVSVILAGATVWLAQHFSPRWGTFNANVFACGVYTVVIVATMLVLPGESETPQPMRDAAGTIIYPGFPADVLYQFRLTSLSTQLVLWVTIGLVFATLAGRLLAPHTQREQVASAK